MEVSQNHHLLQQCVPKEKHLLNFGDLFQVKVMSLIQQTVFTIMVDGGK